MSDEFLYRLREMPRPEFAKALKARVFQERPRSPAARQDMLRGWKFILQKHVVRLR